MESVARAKRRKALYIGHAIFSIFKSKIYYVSIIQVRSENMSVNRQIDGEQFFIFLKIFLGNFLGEKKGNL